MYAGAYTLEREVFMREPNNEMTGDVVLSTRPPANAWDNFLELVHGLGDTDDFMLERPMNTLSGSNGVFDKGI
jgi:antitoxin VapB